MEEQDRFIVDFPKVKGNGRSCALANACPKRLCIGRGCLDGRHEGFLCHALKAGRASRVDNPLNGFVKVVAEDADGDLGCHSGAHPKTARQTESRPSGSDGGQESGCYQPPAQALVFSDGFCPQHCPTGALKAMAKCLQFPIPLPTRRASAQVLPQMMLLGRGATLRPPSRSRHLPTLDNFVGLVR